MTTNNYFSRFNRSELVEAFDHNRDVHIRVRSGQADLSIEWNHETDEWDLTAYAARHIVEGSKSSYEVVAIADEAERTFSVSIEDGGYAEAARQAIAWVGGIIRR